MTNRGVCVIIVLMSNALSHLRADLLQGLTEKQLRFVEEYPKDLDGKEAAVRAGYALTSASVVASRLLNHPQVATLIEAQLEARSARTHFTQDQVLREVAQIGLSNILNYEIDPQGYVSVHPEAPSEAMRAVQSIKRTVKYDKDGQKTIETEIRLWDKISALRLMGRHLGMFIDINVNHTGKVAHEHEHKQVWDFGGKEITF